MESKRSGTTADSQLHGQCAVANAVAIGGRLAPINRQIEGMQLIAYANGWSGLFTVQNVG